MASGRFGPGIEGLSALPQESHQNPGPAWILMAPAHLFPSISRGQPIHRSCSAPMSSWWPSPISRAPSQRMALPPFTEELVEAQKVTLPACEWAAGTAARCLASSLCLWSRAGSFPRPQPHPVCGRALLGFREHGSCHGSLGIQLLSVCLRFGIREHRRGSRQWSQERLNENSG